MVKHSFVISRILQRTANVLTLPADRISSKRIVSWFTMTPPTICGSYFISFLTISISIILLLFFLFIINTKLYVSSQPKHIIFYITAIILFSVNLPHFLPVNLALFNFHRFTFLSSARMTLLPFYFQCISFSMLFPSEYGPFKWPFSLNECVHLDGHSPRVISYCVLYRFIVRSVHLLSDCSPFTWPFSFECCTLDVFL